MTRDRATYVIDYGEIIRQLSLNLITLVNVCTLLIVIKKYNFTEYQNRLNWYGKLVDIIGILGIKFISQDPVRIMHLSRRFLKILFVIIILMDIGSGVILWENLPLELICGVPGGVKKFKNSVG